MVSLRNRVYKYMVLLTGAISIVVVSTITYVTYSNLTTYINEESKSTLDYYTNNLIIEDDIIINKSILDSTQKRVTVINDDGVVIYDNFADINEMDNHRKRPEVIDATTSQYGESKRLSDTISKVTYYYALQTSDNYTVRIAVTTDSIFAMFLDEVLVFIVLILLIIIVCSIIAKVLSKRIVKSIVEYEEINPLVKAINKKDFELEEQTYEIESNLRTMKVITDNMVEGLLVIDSDNNIISLNKKIRTIFNVDKNDYINKDIKEMYKHFDFTKVLSNDNSSTRVEINNIYYNVVSNSVVIDGDYIGKVILFIDITKEEKVSKIRREFSSNVSHELKTPLASILGYSELIEKNVVPIEKKEEFISKIRVEAKNMCELIDDILLISNLDEKESDLSIKKENISEIINSVLSRFKPIIEEKNLELIVNLNTEMFAVNYRLFYEIVYNLIDNAIKYNQDDGKVVITTEDSLVLKVANTGLQIDEVQKDKIFERFYRIEKSRNRSTGGTGLGLAIVKHAVLSHNGTINVSSSEDITEFIVTL